MKNIIIICSEGHVYKRVGSCRICPKCAQIKQKKELFFCSVSAPARRALESVGINSLEDLLNWTIHDLSKLHGIGQKALEEFKSFGLK